jgi:hypothetical protein
LNRFAAHVIPLYSKDINNFLIVMTFKVFFPSHFQSIVGDIF